VSKMAGAAASEKVAVIKRAPLRYIAIGAVIAIFVCSCLAYLMGERTAYSHATESALASSNQSESRLIQALTSMENVHMTSMENFQTRLAAD